MPIPRPDPDLDACSSVAAIIMNLPSLALISIIVEGLSS
jgi:hypothetical protein